MMSTVMTVLQGTCNKKMGHAWGQERTRNIPLLLGLGRRTYNKG